MQWMTRRHNSVKNGGVDEFSSLTLCALASSRNFVIKSDTSLSLKTQSNVRLNKTNNIKSDTICLLCLSATGHCKEDSRFPYAY